MDIIHLLEALKPAGNVVTVKIDDGKSWWESLSTFVITILPALFAGVTLWVSYRQFKSGIRQQVNEMRLSTKLATEVELKKDACREVRQAYLSFMQKLSELYMCTLDIRDLKKEVGEEGGADLITLKRQFRLYHQQCAYSKTLIDSYLDPSSASDIKFSAQLSHAFNLAANENTKGGDFADEVISCSNMCFEFIDVREKEIINLVETIQ